MGALPKRLLCKRFQNSRHSHFFYSTLLMHVLKRHCVHRYWFCCIAFFSLTCCRIQLMIVTVSNIIQPTKKNANSLIYYLLQLQAQNQCRLVGRDHARRIGAVQMDRNGQTFAETGWGMWSSGQGDSFGGAGCCY